MECGLGGELRTILIHRLILIERHLVHRLMLIEVKVMWSWG
jgi:hypothetical protein